MARVISIQEAQGILEELNREFGVETRAPPLYVTARIPTKYAGVYYHQDSAEQIKIRPQYLTARTVAHEWGHFAFHHFRPGECKGDNPECEETARMVEKWWVTGRKRARAGHAQLAERRRIVEFTLTRPMTLEEAKEAARQIERSQIGDAVDRVGFKDKKFYVVLKSEPGADGIIPLLAPIIVGILGLRGIGVVGWAAGLFAAGPLGLPNIFWILVAGTTLLVALGWVVGRLMPK